MNIPQANLRAGDFFVYVDVDGTIIPVYGSPDMTIGMVKAVVCQWFRTTLSDTSIGFRGELLGVDATLWSCGVQHQDYLDLLETAAQ